MNKRRHSYKSYENRKHDDLNIKCKDLEVNIVINGICKKRNISKSDLLIEMVKERYPEEYKIAKANKNTIDSVILCMQMNLEDLDEYEKNRKFRKSKFRPGKTLLDVRVTKKDIYDLIQADLVEKV